MTSLKRSTRIFIRLFCIKNSKMVCDSSCPHCDRISLKVMHQIGLQFSVLIFLNPVSLTELRVLHLLAAESIFKLAKVQ